MTWTWLLWVFSLADSIDSEFNEKFDFQRPLIPKKKKQKTLAGNENEQRIQGQKEKDLEFRPECLNVSNILVSFLFILS